MTIDQDRFEVWVGEKRIELTFVEFELLYALAKSAGKVVPRSRLVLAVWNERSTGEDRKLTVHVSRLRKKLRGSDLWRIETVTKRGYVMASVSEPNGERPTLGPGTARLQQTAGEI
ncbi:MAG TPA: winged helix-turn-helix domain-containing protein [Dehalococcoidia bacterium]|nr:winged helix-turn-helix domain-containing protein [Dehalococcoidia bacterium]